MREGAAPVALAQRPDTHDISAQRIVHGDEAVRIDNDAGAVEPKVVRVGPAADGDEQMRPFDRPTADASSTMAAIAGAALFDADVRAPRCTAMPSASRIPRTGPKSPDPRGRSRGAASITVTSLPNRR